MCGTSRWKAAKSTSKTMKGLDETGVVVAGCRHIIAQKAVNMFRGEMYVCACVIGLIAIYFFILIKIWLHSFPAYQLSQ